MSNLAVRTISGIVFCAVMVCGLILSPFAYGALFLLVMLVSMKEFFAISLGQRLPDQQRIALSAATVLFCLILAHFWFGIHAKWLAVALIPIITLMVSALFIDTTRDDVSIMAYIFVALVYIALPFSLSPILVFRNGMFSGYLLLGLFATIWTSDVGAYCLGTAFGQKPDSKKLAPRISPKKSWWGFWGGVILGTCAGAVLHYVGWFDFPLAHCVALGALISVGTVCGDLFESLWKRYFGVKDSGRIIPGHGGMLDRFDSTLFAIPLAIIYLTLTSLI